MTTSDRPIGVFDSGVGGVSVLREIRRALPVEHLIYLADSAYTPYGDRPAAVIAERSIAMVQLLEQQGVKAVVVACNTATGIAIDALRGRFTMPIVAIEPAVKPAAALTRSGVVGVLATTQTLASERFSKLVEAHAAGVRVVTQPSPGLVERVERLFAERASLILASAPLAIASAPLIVDRAPLRTAHRAPCSAPHRLSISGRWLARPKRVKHLRARHQV